MPKDEYKNLMKTYVNETNIPYITAKQYICRKQMKQLEYENNIKYKHVFLNTYNDIAENGYNISMVYIYINFL
jgi:hypothetical protein